MTERAAPYAEWTEIQLLRETVGALDELLTEIRGLRHDLATDDATTGQVIVELAAAETALDTTATGIAATLTSFLTQWEALNQSPPDVQVPVAIRLIPGTPEQNPKP